MLRCRVRSMLSLLLVFATISYLSISIFNLYNHKCRTPGEKNRLVGILATWWNKPAVKRLVVLSYQRCGSSFFGNMFNYDPDAFYVFEPLDGLYSSLYGTAPGWNVPSDIVSFRNGSFRELSEVELNAVHEYLHNLFDCNVDAFPTQSLAHTFWGMFKQEQNSIGNYTSCLSAANVSYECHLQLKSLCPTQFEAGNPAMARCRDLLESTTAAQHGAPYDNHRRYHDETSVRRFLNYSSCLAEQRHRLDTASCTQTLRTSCIDRNLRVVKLVRGTMKSMQLLLEDDPELLVIHLVRDPRAVALSRRDFHESGQGLYSRDASTKTDQMVREAAIYCRQVVYDVVVRRRLERKFPGRLYSVNYEQLVDDPVGSVQKIYKFIGLPVPETVVRNFNYLALVGQNNITGKSLATRWQKRVSLHLRTKVDKYCAEMLSLFPQYVAENEERT